MPLSDLKCRTARLDEKLRKLSDAGGRGCGYSRRAAVCGVLHIALVASISSSRWGLIPLSRLQMRAMSVKKLKVCSLPE